VDKSTQNSKGVSVLTSRVLERVVQLSAGAKVSAAELRYDIRTIVFALLPTGLSGSFAIDPGLASLLTLACTSERFADRQIA